jgi:DNA-3-methyladenine glycosylase II
MRFTVLNTQTLAAAAALLARRDKQLAQILKTHGKPPLWRRPATFSTLVKIILEQQVSLKSAASMFRKLQHSIAPFTAARIVEVGPEYLRRLGVTRQKTSYLLNVSSAIVAGTLNLRRLSRLPDGDVKEALMRIKGLGSWSADVYLLMAMRRADIWPAGDLALAVAIKELHGLERKPTFEELEVIAEKWRPHRAVAARMLWQYYLSRRTNGQKELAADPRRQTQIKPITDLP